MLAENRAPDDGPAGRDDGKKSRRRFSDILRGLSDDPLRERIAISDILAAMGDRAFGALMLVFALPNVIPTPPGTSGILGAPLVFLAAQLMLGRRPWLPKFILNRSIRRVDFQSLMERADPWLVRAERLMRPRLSLLIYPPAEYVVGLLCFVMAVILVLPIPLGNILPALAICLFSFGILERDGMWVIAGFIVSVVSAVVVSGVVFALVKATIFLLTNALS